LGLCAAFALACAGGPKPPLTSSQLAAADKSPGSHLVRYLGQRDADTGVCDLNRAGPTVAWVSPGVVDQLMKGFDKTDVPPQAFAECVVHLWDAVDDFTWERLAKQVAKRIRSVAKSGRLETDPMVQDRARALVQILTQRSGKRPLDRDVVLAITGDLRKAVDKRGEDSRAGTILLHLLRDLEVEAGLLNGRPVTKADIEGSDNDAQLLGWARRLPAKTGLRELAGERLLDLRIANSPFDLVREQEASVRSSMADKGYFPLPEGQSVMSAVWEPGDGGVSLARVQQDRKKDVIRLLMARADRTLPPEGGLALSDTLWATVEGFPEPISVCPGSDPFDPTPCLPAKSLSMASEVAYLADGVIHFVDQLDLAQLIALGREGEWVKLQVLVGGATVVNIGLKVEFDAVKPMLFEATGWKEGNPGPDLRVVVSELSGARFLYAVRKEGGEPVTVLVPRGDRAFSIVTRGGEGHFGERGVEGKAGRAGRPGSAARCPNTPGRDGTAGTTGGAGTNGGPGRPGGRGGDIVLVLKCDHCDALKDTVERTVRSEGGEAGAGGPGGLAGKGGKGGAGGASATCTEGGATRVLQAGQSGPDGMPGPAGGDGMPGPAGKPGKITVRVNP